MTGYLERILFKDGAEVKKGDVLFEIDARPYQVQVAKAEAVRSTARSWRALNEACRFEIIEQALRAANDRIDGYPIAL